MALGDANIANINHVKNALEGADTDSLLECLPDTDALSRPYLEAFSGALQPDGSMIAGPEPVFWSAAYHTIGHFMLQYEQLGYMAVPPPGADTFKPYDIVQVGQ
jgi:hypothetical protein